MGGLTSSVLGGVQQLGMTSTVLNTVADAVVDAIDEDAYRDELVASQDVALNQLMQAQQLEESQAATSVATEKAQLEADAAATEKQRKAALKKALATQTAAYGASGITSGDGSAQAVLLGVFDESDEEKQDNETSYALKVKALDDEFASLRSSNILERAQLQQLQELELASSY